MSSDDAKEDSFAAMFEREQAPARKKRLRVGDRLQATVVQVGRDSVFVELDGKQQAFLEIADVRDAEGNVTVKEGDTVTAHVVDVDESRGIVRLGKSMGRPGNLAALEQARDAKLAVSGKVTGVNKGGLEIDLGGARAFCPVSQIDRGFVEDMKAFVGQTLAVLVTDIRDGGKSVVVSRKALLARDAAAAAERAMTDIVAGAVLKGTVTSVRDFGAFVDLGGVEGMIPRSEIAHDRSVSVADSLGPGDVVEVQVREVKPAEPGRGGASGAPKITLSLKALQADPWGELSLVEGRVALGTVTRSTEFGRFVRLAPAVEGLLHVSELGKNAKVEEGQEVLVVVKRIDREAKKIGLTLAPEGARPGDAVQNMAIAVGAIVRGAVERIEAYGVFVQIDGTKGRGGRGLVPVGELGVPRGTDLRKAFPEGTVVVAKVLETGEGRLRLSIKGAKADEERADFEQARAKGSAPASLGTFADLLNKKKR
jgi:small subunit ribosomal protein S1